MGPYSTAPNSPVKFSSPTWMVRRSALLVNVSAMSRSFQMKKNCTSATVKIALRTIGKPMEKNVRNMLAPSRVAASKISRGTARK